MFLKKISKHFLLLFSFAILFGTGCDTGAQRTTLPSEASAQVTPVTRTEPTVAFDRRQLEKTMQDFFHELDLKQYTQAYNRFSSAFKSRHPYADWVAGYGNTLSQTASSIKCEGNGCGVEVAATESNQQQAVRKQKYVLAYGFIADNAGQPLIDSGSLESSVLVEDWKASVIGKTLSIAYSPQSEKLVTEVVSPANESTCIWNYTGGNHAIPYQETTKSTQYHSITVLLDGISSDVAVLCRDDFGGTFSGTYTLDKAREDAQSKPAQQPVPNAAPNGTYTNVYGNEVPSPYAAPSAPAGASAQCRDGTYSFSQSRRGTCSHHGGVREWL